MALELRSRFFNVNVKGCSPWTSATWNFLPLLNFDEKFLLQDGFAKGETGFRAKSHRADKAYIHNDLVQVIRDLEAGTRNDLEEHAFRRMKDTFLRKTDAPRNHPATYARCIANISATPL